MNINEEIKAFSKNIIKNIDKFDSEEIIELIKNDEAGKDFYFLCQSYLDIALNAEIFIDKETNDFKCCNKFEDIDIALDQTRNFILRYTIVNTESLLDMIKCRYRESKSIHDTRQTTAFYNKYSKDGRPNFSGFGYFGKLVDLTEIPTWEEIKVYILERLENNI